MDTTAQIPRRPLSIKAAARKLPIKRKNPNPNSPLTPNLELSGGDSAGDRDPPPFKYHRIWTESDEIGFLQALIDFHNDGLVFSRDIIVFYERFSKRMQQPYTKSQLAEKLRRLRKKFRVISARLSRGVDFLALSVHDRALFELSKKLWHSDFESKSPFGKSPNFNKISDSNNTVDGEKLMTRDNGNENASLSPTLPENSFILDHIHSSIEPMIDFDYDDDDSQMNEVKVEYDFGNLQDPITCLYGNRLAKGKNAAKLIFDVFDDALKEIRAIRIEGMDNGSSPLADSSSTKGKALDFEKRWREQRAVELDALASRWSYCSKGTFPYCHRCLVEHRDKLRSIFGKRTCMASCAR